MREQGTERGPRRCIGNSASDHAAVSPSECAAGAAPHFSYKNPTKALSFQATNVDAAKMKKSCFLDAMFRIPAGETRTFAELAEMAGKHGAARAAGRAVASCPLESQAPWHRVVSSQGGLAKSSAKASIQLKRLRCDGSRPSDGEPVSVWAKRRKICLIGLYGGTVDRKVYVKSDDPRVDAWPVKSVEPIASEDNAKARGFRHIDASPPADAPLPVCSIRDGKELPSTASSLKSRLEGLNWMDISDSLHTKGFYKVRHLLDTREVAEIISTVEDAVKGGEGSSRCGGIDRTVELSRFGGGRGKYYYLKEPIPGCCGELQSLLYERLRNDARSVGRSEQEAGSKKTKAAAYKYPDSLQEFFEECKSAGQKRASVILLCYGVGGQNFAHRDIYGAVCFPFQAMLMLSQRGKDYEGGQFFLEETRGDGSPPIVHGVDSDIGDLVLFCSSHRLSHGTKVEVRHGMHAVTAGQRFALGIVFHLAK